MGKKNEKREYNRRSKFQTKFIFIGKLWIYSLGKINLLKHSR